MADESTSGWVYVLDDQQGHYKIGKGKDLAKRIKQLRIQLPYPVTIQYAFQTKNCHLDEKTLHERFKGKRLNGEWFKLELDDLGAIYEFANYQGVYEWCGELVRDPMFESVKHEQDDYERLLSPYLAEEMFWTLAEIASERDDRVEQDECERAAEEEWAAMIAETETEEDAEEADSSDELWNNEEGYTEVCFA